MYNDSGVYRKATGKRACQAQNRWRWGWLIVFLLAGFHGYAQKVTINRQKVSLQTIFDDIRKQTGYTFFYNEEVLKKATKVTLRLQEVSMGTALDQVLSNTGLQYKIVDKTITISVAAPVPDQHMNELKATGVVTSATTGLPLAGASILLKGTKKGTITGADGSFTINVPRTDHLLIISYIGYQAVEVTANVNIRVQLPPSPYEKVEEVVVIGYGTQKRKDVIGSVQRVNITDLTKAPVRAFDEALAGRIAGVQVASEDGQPGAAINIIIRGANSITQDNSPLYVIDGFPREGGDNNNNRLNPQDIESIDVLKDAAATAIYGSRGANGVVLISTKRGKEGPATVTFNANYGIQQIIKKMKTLGPVDYFKLQADNATSNGIGDYENYRFFGLSLRYIRDSAEAINFQNDLFKTGVLQDYSVLLNGGSKMTHYAMSGNYMNQQGILINTSYKRYLGRIVLDHQVNEKLKTGINTAYTYTLGAGASPAAIAAGSASGSLMNSIWGYRPFAGSGNAATNLNADQLKAYPVDPLLTGLNNYIFNPLIDQQHLIRNNKSNNLLANGYIEYQLKPGWTLRISGGIDYTTAENVEFNDSLTLYGSKLSAVGTNGPNGRITNSKVSSWVNENTLNYDNTFKEMHHVNVILGLSEQGYKNRSVAVANTALLYPDLGIDGLSQSAAPGLVSLTQSSGKWTAQSFFGRIQYNYLSKYYFTASLRVDGSSKFSSNNHWSQFPAFGISWRLLEEPFMRNTHTFLSEARLRFTYGKSGNNRIPVFAYLSQVTSGYTGVVHNSTFNTFNNSPAYTFNNVIAPASVLSTLGNDKLKWETTASVNLGVDLGFFNDRINVIADAYIKRTYDLLYNAPVPASLGFKTAFKNIGNVENRGLEISINTLNIKSNHFTWSTSFNIGFNKNKVLALTQGLESAPVFVQWDNSWNNVAPYLLKVGQPLGALYGLIWAGNYQYSDFIKNAAGKYILKDDVPSNTTTRTSIAGNAPQPGDIKYKDLNGDGVITTADQTIIGHGSPLHTGGFGNNFYYKGFDLNLFFQWSYGNKVQNANRLWFENNAIGGRNQFESVKNRWTPGNQNNILFRAGSGSPAGPNFYATRTMEDGSFLRLKTISLGFHLPEKLLKKYKLKEAQVFLSGQNIFTWTKYTGADPEVTVTYGQPFALAPGFDYAAYPRARTFSLGTNFTF